VAVHSILPSALTDAVDEVLRAAGVRHVAHGDGDYDEHGDPVDPLVRFVRYDA
jgi:hypothetical protein